MQNQVLDDQDTLVFSGKIIAKDISYEEFLSGLHGEHAEWIFGVVIAMSPVSIQHALLDQFLKLLFRLYLEMTTGGVVLGDPVAMRPKPDLPARQPDIQIILPERKDYIKENSVEGPANLVVEIVSPESVKRDRGEKFAEYEQGGVTEYWIIDKQRTDALFYVLNADGLYQLHAPIDGIYTSYILPKFALNVNLLWQDHFPTTREIMQMVEAMLQK